MVSLRRTLVLLCAVLSSAAVAKAQLTCNGSLTCNTSTPAYSFTNSGTGNALNVQASGISAVGVSVTHNGSGKGFSLSSTGNATGLYVSTATGTGVHSETSAPSHPAFEGISNYYHGIEINAGKNANGLFHAIKAIQEATNPAVGGYGIYAESSRNTGVYGKSLLAGQYGVYASGNLGASGTKTFVEPHPTDPTKQIHYAALEGPEAGTYFRGTARLVRGFARIPVPEDFRIVSDENGLTVQVTPMGQLALVACVKKDLNEIVIQGTLDVEFDFIVHGVRKSFADFQPIVENRDFVPETADDVHFAAGLPAESIRRLRSNGTLNDDGSVNLETAARHGWDKRETWSRPKAEDAKQ